MIYPRFVDDRKALIGRNQSVMKKLAILVNSDRNLDHVIQLTLAAYAGGKQVNLFLTGKGVLLIKAPQFVELATKASVAVCKVSFKANGLEEDHIKVPGVRFTTQAANAKLLNQADRYLVL